MVGLHDIVLCLFVCLGGCAVEGVRVGETDLALSSNGATCEASSPVYPGYECEAALSGKFGNGKGEVWITEGLGTDAWMTVYLERLSSISRLKVTNRIGSGGSLVKQAKVDFDNDETGWLNFHGSGTSDELQFSPPIVTKWFRISITEAGLGSAGDTGLQEIEAYGIQDQSGKKKLSKCKSAESYPGYSCKGAIDGRFGHDPTDEWASYQMGNNAWITITLPKPSGLVRMEVTNRDFGGGSEVTKALVEFDNGNVRTLEFGGKNTHAELYWDPPILIHWFIISVTESLTGPDFNTGFQEIEVYACPADTFGSLCLKQCYCENPDVGCHPVTGMTADCTCVQNYYPDWTTGTCRKVDAENTFKTLTFIFGGACLGLLIIAVAVFIYCCRKRLGNKQSTHGRDSKTPGAYANSQPSASAGETNESGICESISPPGTEAGGEPDVDSDASGSSILDQQDDTKVLIANN